MEYRILLVRDIKISNLRYSPIKRSSNSNRYSLISYINEEHEMQSLIVQCKQMNIAEISINDKGHYSIVFELTDQTRKFLTNLEQKIKGDVVSFKGNNGQEQQNFLQDGSKIIQTSNKTRNSSKVVKNMGQDVDRGEGAGRDQDVDRGEGAGSGEGVGRDQDVDRGEGVGRDKDVDRGEGAGRGQGVGVSTGSGQDGEYSLQKKDAVVVQNSIYSLPTATDYKDHSLDTNEYFCKQKSIFRFRSCIQGDSKKKLKCRIGTLSNLVVFDQYRKLYEDEKEILKILKNPNVMAVPIIECVGLWISNDNEYGLSWVCHHIKIIQNSTLFKKYLFISDDESSFTEEEEEDDDNEKDTAEKEGSFAENSNFRSWAKNLPLKTMQGRV